MRKSAEDILVSFCIPCYNNGETIRANIEDMLRIGDTRFQIVVVDNKSTDGSLSILREVDDERVKIVENETNIGMQGNFVKALAEGDGQFLYFVLAHDKLGIGHLFVLYENLIMASKQGIKCLRDNRAPKEGVDWVVYNKLDSICKMIGHRHETGIIFEKNAYRTALKNIKDMDREYIYPLNYIYREILVDGRAGSFYSGMNVNSYDMHSKSFSHNVNIKKLWFHPEFRTEQILKTMDLVLLNERLHIKRLDRVKIVLFYWRNIASDVTFIWRARMMSPKFVSHYGIKYTYISKSGMQKNMWKAYGYAVNRHKQKNCHSFTFFEKIVMVVWMLLKWGQMYNPLYYQNIEYKKLLDGHETDSF